jgi:hypothetical protein
MSDKSDDDKEQWREQSAMAKLELMTFADWDNRPAVMLDGKAFAILRPGETWVEVDAGDVGQTAGVMSNLAWRQRFGRFGRLDLTKIPGSPLRPPTAQDFDDAALAAQAAHHEHMAREALKPDYAGASAMAWAQKYCRAAWEDTELALHATQRERKALEAVKRDLESKPTRYGFPGAAALFLSRTLQQIAQDIGDGQLMLYAADMERSARGVIGLYLSFRLPNETAH